MKRCVSRSIEGVDCPDAWYLKGVTTADEVVSALVGSTLLSLSRLGKLLRVTTAKPSGATAIVGLRFGMTGRPVVDGAAAIEDLLYTSNDYRENWVRFRIRFAGGGSFEMVDPRRLGGVELEPIERLGIDVGAVTPTTLRVALLSARGPIKGALLDQMRVAGIGNLIVDEVLWQCGIAPARPVPDLEQGELDLLARTIASTFKTLLKRGGSHLGDHMPERHRLGCCPKDGTAFSRATVGGRTTYWCPVHQR